MKFDPGTAAAIDASGRSLADRGGRRRSLVRSGAGGRCKGLVCPNADHLVRFRVEGPGVIAGVDNGDPINHDSFKAAQHKVFHGLGLVIVKGTRTPGRISLRAEAKGLDRAEIVLQTSSDEPPAR